MMNAELAAKNLTKIMIPIVYTDDHQLALNKISQHQDFQAFIQSMLNIYAFSATVLGDTKNEMERYLRSAMRFIYLVRVSCVTNLIDTREHNQSTFFVEKCCRLHPFVRPSFRLLLY
jgi:hypothetical protein